MNLKKFIKLKNKKKILFTPGPASLSYENIISLSPCFGRNDIDYKKIEDNVLNKIKNISGHKEIIRLQGSSSLALEIGIHNFLFGKVLLVSSGFYSTRLFKMLNFSQKNFNNIKKIISVDWKNIKNIDQKFDWIVACYTETSMGFKIPIADLFELKKKSKAALFLDATASIGLEEGHELSDVCCFSSCKGLFGLTGAAFIAFNKKPNNKIDSFNLNIYTYINKLMTGPYHAILSIYKVLQKYQEFKFSVIENKKKFIKKFGIYSQYDLKNQPLLCTYIKKKINDTNKKIILYKPRINLIGSIVCHLGEVHLKTKSRGIIVDSLKIKK